MRIINGPFAGVEGIIAEMDDDTKEAAVTAVMFGRETPTDIKYKDLELIETVDD